MQQNTPDREPDMPGMGHPAGWGSPTQSPFTDAEWKTLVEAPVKIGRAIIAISPSGGIGMAKEVRALRSGLTEAIEASNNPILKELGWRAHMEGGMESLWQNVSHAFGDRWDAENVRKTAMAAIQEVMLILRKVSPQDAMAYKECIYSAAQKVAYAGKEGGFMGIGGKLVSEPEENFLRDMASTLGLQRS
jgi:hypothetical protein